MSRCCLGNAGRRRRRKKNEGDVPKTLLPAVGCAATHANHTNGSDRIRGRRRFLATDGLGMFSACSPHVSVLLLFLAKRT